MKRIINGKLYNTDTARRLGTLPCDASPSDFRWQDTTLFLTRGGAFFLVGSGGAMSMWAQRIENNGWSGGEGLKPITHEEARTWLERMDAFDALEELFGPAPEATADDDPTAW